MKTFKVDFSSCPINGLSSRSQPRSLGLPLVNHSGRELNYVANNEIRSGEFITTFLEGNNSFVDYHDVVINNRISHLSRDIKDLETSFMELVREKNLIEASIKDRVCSLVETNQIEYLSEWDTKLDSGLIKILEEEHLQDLYRVPLPVDSTLDYSYKVPLSDPTS